MLSNIPIEIQDIVYDYANDIPTPLKLTIKTYDNDDSVYLIWIEYGPVLYDYGDITNVSVVSIEFAHNIKITQIGGSQKYIHVSEHMLYFSGFPLSIMINCDKIRNECNRFIDQCRKVESDIKKTIIE